MQKSREKYSAAHAGSGSCVGAGRVVAMTLAVTLAMLVSAGACADGKPQPKPNPKPKHPKSRMAGLKLIEFSDGKLQIHAERATKGLLVLYSSEPLVVETANGAEAKLIPGWDGTIGYSHYGLELQVPAAGKVVVQLRSIGPPDKPIPETAEDLAEFKRRFGCRPSRFPESVDEFAAWQETYRGKLAALLMGGGLPKRVPLDARVVETKDYEKFTLRRIKYQSRPGRDNFLLLSLPKGKSKVPLLLALHGHEAPWGEADENAYSKGHADDFMAHFAERGWAVLQPATMNHKLQNKDWTLQGEWTWDAMAALDYGAAVPEIDMSRVAVCGLSTGAHLAMNVLALDERVKAGVVGCVLSTWNHSHRRLRIPPHCDCGISFQLDRHLEQCDWAALAAPKPVQFQHGRKDACFCPYADEKLLDMMWNTGLMPVAEFDTMFAEVKRAYGLAGKSDAVEIIIHDGPHKVDNQAAYEWLNGVLRK